MVIALYLAFWLLTGLALFAVYAVVTAILEHFWPS